MTLGGVMDWQALRSDFAITRNYNYQNHAAIAPMCRRAVEAAKRQLDHSYENAYLGGGFSRRAEHVRQRAADLINARPDEICFVKNTTEGLSFVANGLKWQRGDNVVTTNVEFPANMYPWMALQDRGVELQIVIEENGRVPLDRVIESVNARTRVVAISAVQYASGFRTDLAALGEYCASRGVLLCVDAIQALGAFPIDVKAMNIDFLSAGSHKWLCGPQGLGTFYVRKEVQGLLQPTTVGYMSMKNPTLYDKYHFEFQDSARRYDSGGYNTTGIFALGGALEMIHEIGVDAIATRLTHLTDILVEGLRSRGYQVISSRRPGESSGIVAFTSDYHDHNQLQMHLEKEHRLVIAHRAGRLRASPHFYTSQREIEQLVELLPAH